MSLTRLLGWLWRRHRWEVVLVWVSSWLGSWVALHGRVDEQSWSPVWMGVRTDAFVWMEVAAVVWLTGRVALSQQGFGTFGGWRTRPLRAWRLWLSEVLFLVIVCLPALLIRLRCVLEMLAPDQDGWARLWSGNWGGLLIYHGALFVLFKCFGHLGNRMPGITRQQAAWLLLLTVVVGALFSHQSVLKGTMHLGRSGGSSGSARVMVPAGLKAMDYGRWLVDGHAAGGGLPSDDPSVVRLPLRKGATADGGGCRIRVLEAGRIGVEAIVRIDVVAMEELANRRQVANALMIRYGNGYFGAATRVSQRKAVGAMPFLPMVRYLSVARLHSPLALPENEQGWDELMDGAELYVAVRPSSGPGVALFDGRWDLQGGNPLAKQVADILDDARRRAPRNRAFARAKDQLFQMVGAAGVESILERGPWESDLWETVVLPYLVAFANERHRPRMLEVFEVNTQMGAAFPRKGWTEEAMPLLRRHLKDGRKLEPESLLALIALGEEDMGPMLENQLLRLDGEVDAVAEALQTHPGVDWDGVKREGWKRAKLGSSPHHVRVKWGAELGDKEALRQMLVKAIDGNAWERDILREWFDREDAVERLRDGWDQVTFQDGRWVLDADGT